MIVYEQQELTPAAQYKILSGSIIPRPIAWITTISHDGTTVNLAPFSLFTIVSKEHPLVSVSVMRVEGEQKDTAYNLTRQKEGVIHLVNPELVTAMNASSASLPRTESELPLTNLSLVTSKLVKPPSLEASLVRFEVKLYQQIEVAAPASSEIISDLFILEVVAFHLAETVFNTKTGYISATALNPIARLSGPEYGRLGERFSLTRPN